MNSGLRRFPVREMRTEFCAVARTFEGITNLPVAGFFKPQISTDAKRVYFVATASVTNDAVYSLDIVLGTLKLLYFGLGIEVITEGKHSGYVLAHRAVPIRRAASSIASTIAEGCGREGVAELARFFIIARSSASELEFKTRMSGRAASNSFQSPV
jgi:hypothetical protein